MYELLLKTLGETNLKYFKQIDGFSLIEKFNIDLNNLPIVSDEDLNFNFVDKALIVEKLLEAHNLAFANVTSGNITGRGFATNVCTYDDVWSLGTNFNNTRNDISSICGERSAILSSYNSALVTYLKQGFRKKFDFKIKYLCMGTSLELDKIKDFIVPCEDCLSWLNTNRYFDEETIIFGFEKFEDKLALHATKLANLLPQKKLKTTVDDFSSKEIFYTKSAQEAMMDFNLNNDNIINLLNSSKKCYLENDFCKFSNQNTTCSILSNGKIFSSFKLDWTKRWFIEPLESASLKAIESQGANTFIQAIAYFGDEGNKENNNIQDGLISIKSLGRIRRKYASDKTLLILNLKDKIQVMTIGDYLPKKFIQGYKI